MVEINWDAVLDEIVAANPRTSLDASEVIKLLLQHAARKVRAAGKGDLSDPEADTFALGEALSAVELWDAIRYAALVTRVLEERPGLCDAILQGRLIEAEPTGSGAAGAPAIDEASLKAAEEICAVIIKAVTENDPGRI